MLPLYMGGSADRRYNLSFIVRNSVDLGTPIVAVSLNYRLSAFGFMVGKEALDAGATNIGFRDQRLALHWVRENIVHFGGSPKKVTIFGESSGAESMTAHVIAYDGTCDHVDIDGAIRRRRRRKRANAQVALGRDDGLFRSVMGDSGFGGIVARYPGGFNATEAMQESYDAFVKNTSCAPTVNTAASLDCLRNLPFDEIDGAINNTDSGPWAPVLDGDFITGWPSAQLRDGKFVKVPVLIGSNTDEGTAFGVAGINTDEEFAAIIAANIAPGVEFTTGKTAAQLTAEVENFYPNIQAAGEPSLKKWPVIMPGDAVARSKGLQWRRSGAFFGDR